MADLVRTDAHDHRPLAGDSDEAGAIRVRARAHQGLVWMRQRQANGLRSALRDDFPGALLAFGADLASPDALAERFDRHPGAEILRGLAGLGPVLGARVLGEFGDDPSRYGDARGRAPVRVAAWTRGVPSCWSCPRCASGSRA